MTKIIYKAIFIFLIMLLYQTFTVRATDNSEECNLILDVDMTCDMDDIIAIRMATSLSKRNNCSLKAVTSSVPGNEKKIAGILEYDNLKDVLIGKSTTEIKVASSYLNSMPDGNMFVYDSPYVYKSVLTDNSNVVILVTGYVDNFYNILQNPEILNLVKTKCKYVVITGGGSRPNGMNIANTKERAKKTQWISENCKVPLYFIDYQIGKFQCGQNILTSGDKNDPVRIGCAAHKKAEGWSYSWDPNAVLLAVLGLDSFNSKMISVDVKAKGTKALFIVSNNDNVKLVYGDDYDKNEAASVIEELILPQ